MKRGQYNGITDYQPYVESEKRWLIELRQVQMIWYTALVQDLEPVSCRENNKTLLKKFKKWVENGIEKRFIYFIATRKKVRFADVKPYWSSDGVLNVFLLIGRDRELKSVKVPAFTKSFEHVDVTEETITFHDGNDNGDSYQVHVFLRDFDVNLGFETVVEYVGKTKNPDKRPTDGNHAGLSRVLHKAADGDTDVFLMFNLFKVVTRAERNSRGQVIVMPNSLSDEVGVDKEADIIEKSFIRYFDAECQSENRTREMGELKNNLKQITDEHNIVSVSVSYGVKGGSDYYRLKSKRRRAGDIHEFNLSIAGGEVAVSQFDISWLHRLS